MLVTKNKPHFSQLLVYPEIVLLYTNSLAHFAVALVTKKT
jgi:hypothetical protein